MRSLTTAGLGCDTVAAFVRYMLNLEFVTDKVDKVEEAAGVVVKKEKIKEKGEEEKRKEQRKKLCPMPLAQKLYTSHHYISPF